MQLEKVSESIKFINEKFEEFEVKQMLKKRNSRIKRRFGIPKRKVY